MPLNHRGRYCLCNPIHASVDWFKHHDDCQRSTHCAVFNVVQPRMSQDMPLAAVDDEEGGEREEEELPDIKSIWELKRNMMRMKKIWICHHCKKELKGHITTKALSHAFKLKFDDGKHVAACEAAFDKNIWIGAGS